MSFEHQIKIKWTLRKSNFSFFIKIRNPILSVISGSYISLIIQNNHMFVRFFPPSDGHYCRFPTYLPLLLNHPVPCVLFKYSARTAQKTPRLGYKNEIFNAA